MTRRALGAAAVAATLFGAAAIPARADAVDATLGFTINALSGKHEVTGGSTDRLSFAPLPLAELIVRYRAGAVRIEGLPSVTFGYGSSGDGAQSTRLSIVTATYRQSLGHGLFVGVGQTVYNQLTTYTPVDGGFFYTRGAVHEAIDGSEAQYSRVTGVRMEAGQIIAAGRDRVEYWIAANPKLHGVQYTRIPTFRSRCAGCAQIVDTFSDPENGSQIDLSARVAHRVSKHGEMLYGLRYLNYAAHYDDFPGMLADRNVGFAPTIGYRARI